MLVGGATTDRALSALDIPTEVAATASDDRRDGDRAPTGAVFRCLACLDGLLYPCLVVPDHDPVTPRGRAAANAAAGRRPPTPTPAAPPPDGGAKAEVELPPLYAPPPGDGLLECTTASRGTC